MTSWLRIGVRIAVLAGVFGELQRQGAPLPLDVSVPEGDFNLTMAVWYARSMGLPIANVICGCGDGSDVWNLIHSGQLRTGAGCTKELERLIYGTLGIEENLRYCEICSRAEAYVLNPFMLEQLRNGLYAAVVSDERKNAAIPNVFSTNAYILEPDAAIAYSALLDYRARTGETRSALLLADHNPGDRAGEVCAALQISEEKLKELLL